MNSVFLKAKAIELKNIWRKKCKKRKRYTVHSNSIWVETVSVWQNLNNESIDLISVADPGCLSRIPDPTFFHPGSRNRAVSIPDPGSSSKNLSILTPKKNKKWFLSSKKYDPGFRVVHLGSGC